jgi:peptidoglycan/xylan/chitin deacetylase (PgdA/CDA1 family)
MYHRIGDGALPGRESGEESYAVSPDVFEAQLDALQGSRGHVVGYGELPSAKRFPVLITFDDGNATDHEIALPALRRRGYSAVFFVTPAWLGTPGYMTWDQVADLADQGMTVGAHGLDHTPLSSLSGDGLKRHLADARSAFESRLGRCPDTLSLPGGFGSRDVVEAAHAAGFRVVFGSEPRRATALTPGVAVPRFAVRRGEGLGPFRALVAQRPLALAEHRVRHAALRGLRSVVGAGLYRRVRDLRMRWSSAS